MKYEDCKNCHFSGVPGTNVLGATDTLFCGTTAKGNTKVFESQEGSSTNLPELTLATSLAPGLQAPAGSDMAFRLLILWISGGVTGGS